MNINELKEKLMEERNEKEKKLKKLIGLVRYRKEGWIDCLNWVLSIIEVDKINQDKWAFRDATGF